MKNEILAAWAAALAANNALLATLNVKEIWAKAYRDAVAAQNANLAAIAYIRWLGAK